MVVQVPFHRWGGEGVPLPVRQQLFEIGAGATCCVVCGHVSHGVHNCPNVNSPEGQALAAAWDKKWLLLLWQELIRYSFCPDDAEYRRLCAALPVKSIVDHMAVLAFQRQHAIKSTSPGYGGSVRRRSAKQPTTSQPAPVPQPSAHSKQKPPPKPKPKPKQVPKRPPRYLLSQQPRLLFQNPPSAAIASAEIAVGGRHHRQRARRPMACNQQTWRWMRPHLPRWLLKYEANLVRRSAPAPPPECRRSVPAGLLL